MQDADDDNELFNQHAISEQLEDSDRVKKKKKKKDKERSEF